MPKIPNPSNTQRHAPAVSLAAVALALVLSACASTGAAPAAVLDEGAFTDAYVARVLEHRPGYRVERDAALRLRIGSAADESVGESTVFLASAYDTYREDASQLDTVLDDYALAGIATAESVSTDVALDIDTVVPVIKGAGYVEGVTASLSNGATTAKPLDIYSEPLNAHLDVLYAVDTDDSMRFLHAEDVETLGLSSAALRRRATDNLLRNLGGFDVHAQRVPGVVVVSANGSQEASLLIAEALWQDPRAQFRGEAIVAVPRRDVLVIADGDSAEAVEVITSTTPNIFATAPYPISDQLFVRRDGEWVVYR